MKQIRLTHIAMAAVLAILAHAEFAFGRDVLGLPELEIGSITLSLALAVPFAIDSYVIAALRAGRDIPYALALTALSVAAGTAAAVTELPAHVQLIAAAVFGAVMAVVLWRVHELEHADQRASAQLAQLSTDLHAAAQDRRDALAEITRLSADLEHTRQQADTARQQTVQQQGEVARLTAELRRAQAQPRQRTATKKSTASSKATPKTTAQPAELPADVVELGAQIAQELTEAGTNLTHRTLTDGFRARGHSLSNNRASALLAELRAA